MRRRRARRACVAAVFAATLALSLVVGPVLAASPSPGTGDAGDTRSSGEGAGFAGQPLLVAVAVVALGTVTAGATTLLVRMTRARST